MDLVFLHCIANTDIQGLSVGGWTMMLTSVGVVLGLSMFCLYRMFRGAEPSQHHHAPLEIDTRDLDNSPL
ncbi:MAG: hypothetical protein PHF14_01270 [Verrucomicrobiota bacterium]|jgi:hypothetical protein|nr:hypothetical protein [Verrucomicrobiota bacterium]MDD8045074.1 hypothetical protein [Verrucomicrobiota bacterium]MDD8051893.1 hypothetical protein [Verrucomicrobiota bacterium]MDI9383890.1 hypothetical protein [Verrucomicrobiota bacterium]HCF96605.1 hypothetical protein [Verrucomicrobiota bacterium]